MRLFRALLCFLACSCVNGVEWFQKGPIYQVYVASFADSDGDGIGDLKGVIKHAQHFKDINVAAVWLSPIFSSPMKDNGYDVSNYVQINPTYGTMEDFEELVRVLHNLNIKIMLDFVPNHSSDEHEWFKKSVKKEGKYADYYVWRDKIGTTKHPNGSSTPTPPNNWRSFFTPSAWTWNEERQQFYLHQFGEYQPDLNFDNQNVIDDMKDTMRFWLKKGVDGMRIDATPNIIETNYDKNEPNVPGCTPLDVYNCQQHLYTSDQPKLYDIMAEFAKTLEEFNNNGTRYQFAEAYSNVEWTMKYYMNSTSPFNFNFISLFKESSNASELSFAIHHFIDNMPNGSWPNWVAGNHDNARVATRYGVEMVDVVHTLTMLLPGAPITYQGEEIGMTNTFVPENLKQDHSSFDRDGARTPMQWDGSLNAGFSKNATPYLPVNPNYWEVNVEAENKSPKSHLSIYKELVTLHNDLVAEGLKGFETFIIKPWVFAFSRPNHLVVINLNNMEETFSLKEAKVNGKELPKSLKVRFSSGNSNFAKGFEVHPTNITMRPRSSVVFSVKSFANSVASPSFLVSLVAFVYLVKFLQNSSS